MSEQVFEYSICSGSRGPARGALNLSSTQVVVERASHKSRMLRRLRVSELHGVQSSPVQSRPIRSRLV
ncbi:hypothetical protein MPTK1_6g00700 [Marchantia polymorpha subsp. ruderalis]|uniref:Uncharacterized protein n=2 Tax=Marchantia polymorpha TaxID=3197 RepID=A0AAF6BM55_MARPO|nr:hypothetical protein MARPO_0052s0130 [Marchantia polymorpha]BBN13089.1 hypothetical protein Mp_6g00700 [Marchantia polymorpha subsp. ruderalis]|eukprot:PTQ38358.1 hypothetical protein MARPO_0052s0130 [Marchantia polymorpha]